MKKTKDINAESAILEAAKNIFLRKGMEGTRMQEIADEAEINKALLHYYFRNKQLLFEAVFKQSFLLLAPQLNDTLNSDSSIFEKIRDFCTNYNSFIIEHPYLPNFIIQELNRDSDFLTKIIDSDDFPSLSKFQNQVDLYVERDLIKPINSSQLFINLISLNALPFLAAPLLKGFLKVDEDAYQNLLQNRKNDVAEFIINAIKL